MEINHKKQLEQFEYYLECERIDDAAHLYSQKEFETIKNTAYWDLASLFCTYLNKQTLSEKLCDESSHFCMKSTLDLVTHYGNPKELILIYLESAQVFFINDEKYVKFIEILSIVLKRMDSQPNRKAFFYSLDLAVKCLANYLKQSIQLPLNLNLNDKQEKILFDNDTRVERCIVLVNVYLDFIHDFSVRLAPQANKVNKREIKVIMQTLLDLLGDPLINLNLEYYDDLRLNEASIKCCEKAFLLIRDLTVTNDLFNLIVQLDSETDMEARVPIGFLAYLVYVKDFTRLRLHDSLPTVYAHIYLFEELQPFISSLLNMQHQFGIDKGKNLFHFSICFLLSQLKYINQIFPRKYPHVRALPLCIQYPSMEMRV
jgi:hypothetical protein